MQSSSRDLVVCFAGSSVVSTCVVAAHPSEEGRGVGGSAVARAASRGHEREANFHIYLHSIALRPLATQLTTITYMTQVGTC